MATLERLHEVPGYAYYGGEDGGSLVHEDDRGDTILPHHSGRWTILEEVASRDDAVEAARQWSAQHGTPDEPDTAHHEARIHELDRALAPGSETALLGDALRGLRRADDPDAELAWWVGAYRMLGWAREYPDRWSRDVGRGVWDSPDEQILSSGEDWTGWAPPAPSPADLVAWREAEGLTQSRAAALAGVDISAWQRWESGARSVPQWLSDTLLTRWGSAP